MAIGAKIWKVLNWKDVAGKNGFPPEAVACDFLHSNGI